MLVPVLSVQDDFKKKTGAKPIRSVIQSDDAADIAATAPIIPGTGVMFFQHSAGDILCGKDQCCVDAAPYPEWLFAKESGNGMEKSSHAINWKHEYGRMACQGHVSAPELV